ncbi:MAG: recombinase RecF, partial [Betaproteobacteria bacterium]|nr:recombinase RecF [Betaproteobacteria bacterium]
GKDKAAKWVPESLPPESDKAAARHSNALEKRNEVDAELAKANQELGALNAEVRRYNDAAGKATELAEHAGRIDRIKAKLATDEAQLAEWQQKVTDTRAKAGKAQVDPTAPGEFLLRGLAAVTDEFLVVARDYPEPFNADLINRAEAHMVEYKRLHGWPHSSKDQADPEAVAALPDYENALRLSESAVTNGRRDLEAAQQAAEQLEAIGKSEKPDTEAAQALVADLTAKRASWQADADKYRDIADKHARREALIEQAGKHHQDVIDWTDIADKLAPDGIPATLLTEALWPINDRLAQSAIVSEWPRVTIDDDMTIYASFREGNQQQRPYALLSESEKWRADAMIAEAISHLAGVKLLVLDRFDVLDLDGRSDLLFWLEDLAAQGEIETALIFGTLKGLPAQLPAAVGAYWIDNGIAGQLEQAA